MATMAEQWMNQGREEGMEKGMEKGRLIGTIQTCADIIGKTLDESALQGMSPEELQQLAGDLQSQVRSRLDKG